LAGSSFLELKGGFQESLAGRKRFFYLFPLSLQEVIAWRFPFLSKSTQRAKVLSSYDLCSQTAFALFQESTQGID